MESWNLCCCRVGIGTEGVGGVLAILFKVETNWYVTEIPTREILTREALHFS